MSESLLPLRRLNRFWSRIDKSGGESACWPWMGALASGGYGRVHVKGRSILATHIVLHLDNRPRPSTKHFACHACDNPPRCNPAHLWWGTSRDNIQDASRKGRMLSGAPKIDIPLMVEMRARGDAIKVIAKHFDVHFGSIYRALAHVRNGNPDGRGRH